MKLSKLNPGKAVVITIMTAAIMLTGVGCSEKEDTAPLGIQNETLDIVETAIASNPGQFNTLVEAVVAADLVSTLKGAGPYTVFAPTDQAFAKLGVDLSMLSKEELTNILLYHVVAGNVESTSLANGFVETANGYSIEINTDNGAMINTANVISADVMASNGIIHVIDEVLLPPTEDIVDKALSFNPEEFNTLVSAVIQADLVSTLKSEGPFTVFAPTDAAFAKLGVDLESLSKEELTNILLYHVVPASVFSTDLSDGSVQTASGLSINISLSEGVRINESNVIIANVQTTNGVIHVIDQVLIPAQ
jgi:transforming growth factor-beta-induced protein